MGLEKLNQLIEAKATDRRAAAEACRDYLQANFSAEQRAHMNAVLDRFGGSVEVEGVGRICRRPAA